MTNIVMLIKDRYILTKQALESLRKHTDCNAYTLTLVDDDSIDFRVVRLLRDEVLAASGNTTLLTVERSTHRLGQLKNLGAFWSEQTFGRKEYIYFSDNDVYFTWGWLDKLVNLAPVATILGGQSHPYHRPLDVHAGWTEHDCLAGVSMLMRSETWNESGGFRRDTALGVCQSEDFDFTQRMRARGLRIGVISPHVVIHTGIINSEGRPAVGSELFPRVPGVIYG
jgi:hypothetical protein